ncbi:MAG: hypothetical protein RLZZ522_2018 [Verrucomicrobiota bacterium]
MPHLHAHIADQVTAWKQAGFQCDECPEGPFVQNALVFAPVLTIMRSLRQMAALPFDRILPPRLFKHFAATVKLIFTGALTSSAKSDFAIEYKDADGKWRSYTPDFILRRKDGRCLIIEIKDERHEAGIDEDLRRDQAGLPPVTHEGIKAIALKRWTRLNPERLKYELVFASKSLRPGATDEACAFAASGPAQSSVSSPNP